MTEWTKQNSSLAKNIRKYSKINISKYFRIQRSKCICIFIKLYRTQPCPTYRTILFCLIIVSLHTLNSVLQAYKNNYILNMYFENKALSLSPAFFIPLLNISFFIFWHICAISRRFLAFIGHPLKEYYYLTYRAVYFGTPCRVVSKFPFLE